MHSVNDIRRSFLDFFQRHQHTVVPSCPLIPYQDPTLMFVAAGMVQFKNAFTGVETLPYTRAVSSQKCVRAGGKHNDLDNVGYTARHHTFFEMLGNFSFGDYFKERAITLAWDFLTKELKIPEAKLYITIYHTDDEAYDIWRKIGLPAEKIIRIATNDNFWSMGDTGPCGPCSEIFYDHGPEIPGGLPGSPEEDGDRYIEIWNLVFMQYEQMANGERVKLPKPSIDTGMGLERISAVMQGVHDNYDIDVFKHLIEAIAQVSGQAIDNTEYKSSYRVIADHLRSSCFLIADGVLPSNEGRGYVLRRIMRRAMRHTHYLCPDKVTMYLLVPALIKEMGDAYPELKRAEALITETLMLEEERFKQTLSRGLKLLEEKMVALPASSKLPGETAFELYDTYGFPLDLTKDILRQKGLEVDDARFEQSMKKQRDMSRAAWSGSGEKATQEIWFDIRSNAGATEFLGYDHSSAQGKIVALVMDGKQVESASGSGKDVAVIVNQTPFYAESGGQMGDVGTMSKDGAQMTVTDTKKYVGDLHAHMVTLGSGSLAVGDVVTLTIDPERRDKLRANHSATHLLHAVLRAQLGEQVTQKGSLVAPERLRFDFSYPKAVTRDDIATVEAKVNALIRQNAPVATVLTTPEAAIEKGAMALFGEKYGKEVRVVSMGHSVELCGGTHVQRTGDIGLLKILSESAIAAGVRRIEALTGAAAFEYLSAQERALATAAAVLKVTPDQVATRAEELLDERKKLTKELSEAKRAALTSGSNAEDASETINGIIFIGKLLEDVPAKDLRSIAETFKNGLTSGVVSVVSVAEGKASMVVAVTEDLKNRIDAVSLVKAGASAVGGSGGGGRPEMAQAGGPEGDNASKALDAMRNVLRDVA